METQGGKLLLQPGAEHWAALHSALPHPSATLQWRLRGFVLGFGRR